MQPTHFAALSSSIPAHGSRVTAVYLPGLPGPEPVAFTTMTTLIAIPVVITMPTTAAAGCAGDAGTVWRQARRVLAPATHRVFSGAPSAAWLQAVFRPATRV